MSRRPRVCLVTAAPLTIRAFLRDHLQRLAQSYEVCAVSSFTPDDDPAAWLPGITPIPLAIARNIDPIADVIAFSRLYRLFRRQRFDVVHSVTPKAGLLATSAARLAGIPIRIHCFTGQVWATRTGAARLILKSADRVTAMNATHVLADSHSQRDFLLTEGVGRRIDVLADGSISGVDVARFRPDAAARSRVRAALGIPDNARVILFLGRLQRDKGVLDLAHAFVAVANNEPNAWLLLVGPNEGDMHDEIGAIVKGFRDRVRSVGYTAEPESYMAASDIFALPSYREGFGSVIIEAAACGIPAVASRIYGLTDAVVDGSSGLLHTPGQPTEIAAQLNRLIVDDDLRQRLGAAALARARSTFRTSLIVDALSDYYERMLSKR